MSEVSDLSDDQWAEVDDLIVACEQVGAMRRVRELTGAGPEDAEEIIRLRFQGLRTARPGDFAWNGFACGDYLASGWADRGCWDDPSQTMLIVPAWEVEVRDDIGLLSVGGPGVDGIEWGYRRGETGVWAYHPIDQEFTWMAATTADLVQKWSSGELKVLLPPAPLRVNDSHACHHALGGIGMRLPRVRLTVRRMMVLVADLAIMMGGVTLMRRRAERLERLAWLAGREAMLRGSDPEAQQEIASPYLKHGKEMGVAEALEEIALQRRRFEYAASHPWSAIPPEPN